MRSWEQGGMTGLGLAVLPKGFSGSGALLCELSPHTRHSIKSPHPSAECQLNAQHHTRLEKKFLFKINLLNQDSLLVNLPKSIQA